MNTSSLLANPSAALSAVNQQLEGIRNRFALAQANDGEKRLQELKKAAQEFEAIFVNYMLKVMRETVEPADDESQALGKDVYLSMFDQEMSLSIARSNSLGIGEMLYRQLETQVKEQSVDKQWKLPQTVTPLPQPSSPGATLEMKEEHPHAHIPESRSTTADWAGRDVPAWSVPVEGHLSSRFGVRKDPLTQAAGFHRGIDIAADAGTAIRAAQPGAVVFSGYLRGYGNTIVLEHANGFRSLYGHASRNLVSAGEVVSADQVIGEVGSTGRSTGTHLHFELQKSGESLDPQDFFVTVDVSRR